MTKSIDEEVRASFHFLFDDARFEVRADPEFPELVLYGDLGRLHFRFVLDRADFFCEILYGAGSNQWIDAYDAVTDPTLPSSRDAQVKRTYASAALGRLVRDHLNLLIARSDAEA
jgi:hypothetical protein